MFIFSEKGDLILARLTPAGYDEMSRTHILDPDMPSSGGGGRKVRLVAPGLRQSLRVRPQQPRDRLRFAGRPRAVTCLGPHCMVLAAFIVCRC